MQVRLEGVEELQRALKQFGVNMDKEVGQAVNATAQGVRTQAIKSIQRGPATGEVYEKYSPNRTHRASAPGEAPATDTGRLAGSVSVRKSGTMTAYVFTSVEYGPHLEFGTQNMAARPWLFPALESQRAEWMKRLNGVVEKANRRIRRV